MFDFGVGGRMVNLFGSTIWGPRVNRDDARHMAESAQVRDFCITWPLQHEEEFGNLVGTISKFCTGKSREAQMLYDAYRKHENSSEIQEVSLSGTVDLRDLPARQKNSRQVLQLLCHMTVSQEAAGRQPKDRRVHSSAREVGECMAWQVTA
jgi:hypothetical protein